MSHARLSGVRTGKPNLSLTVDRGTAAPPLAKLSLKLPKGLSIHRSKLTRGLKVSGAGKLHYTPKVAHGTLTLSLASMASSITISLSAPALSAAPSLVSAAHQRHPKRLAASVAAVDASGTTTSLSFSLVP